VDGPASMMSTAGPPGKDGRRADTPRPNHSVAIADLVPVRMLSSFVLLLFPCSAFSLTDNWCQGVTH
jgi:hypothetical protein